MILFFHQQNWISEILHLFENFKMDLEISSVLYVQLKSDMYFFLQNEGTKQGSLECTIHIRFAIF